MKTQKRFRLPRLSRRGKILRNTLGIVLLLAVLWAVKGYPMPTDTLNFRRVERQNLLGPTQIVLEIPKGRWSARGTREDGTAYYRSGSEGSAQFVGLGEGYAVSVWIHPFHPLASQLYYWPLEEQEGEIKLIPLVSFFTDRRNGGERNDRYTCCGIVALNLPDGTDTVEMTIWEDGTEYREQGTQEREGGWLFAFQSTKQAYSSGWLQGLPYVLTAYDGEGNVLARQEGNVPEREG